MVSRALTWATKGDAPIADSRIRRPFQTHRVGFGRSSLFKSTRFHFDNRDIKTKEGSGEVDIVIEPEPVPIHWDYIGQGKKILVDPSPQTASLIAIQERVREALNKALASEAACHRRSLSSESHIIIQRNNESGSPTHTREVVSANLSPVLEDAEITPQPTVQVDHVSLKPKSTDRFPAVPFSPSPETPPTAKSPDAPHVRFILPPVKGLKKSPGFHKPYQMADNVSGKSSSLYQPSDYRALKIQKVWRGYIARKRLKLSKVVHSIFDPYFRDSPRRSKLASGWTFDRLPSFGAEVSFSN